MLEGYPPAVARVFDLDPSLLPAPRRSPCASCPMVEAASFESATRCCTYHPDLPCFSVGQALEGPGAEWILARLQDREGLLPEGITASLSFRRVYLQEGAQRFGRDPELACPFLDQGRCAIHLWRGPVCRGWWCRYDGGRAHLEAWQLARALLVVVTGAIGALCTRDLRAPMPWASPARWEDHYRACAEAVLALGEDELEPLHRALTGERLRVRQALTRPLPQMPEHLRTHAPRAEPLPGGRWRLEGWSPWEPVEVPAEGQLLLRILASGGEWREALEEVERQTGVALGEELVRELWLAEVLQ